MGCSVSHSRRKEKGWAYLEDTLVAGKGLGEGRTNSAAARPVVAAREGREERVLVSEREMGKVTQARIPAPLKILAGGGAGRWRQGRPSARLREEEADCLMCVAGEEKGRSSQ